MSDTTTAVVSQFGRNMQGYVSKHFWSYAREDAAVDADDLIQESYIEMLDIIERWPEIIAKFGGTGDIFENPGLFWSCVKTQARDASYRTAGSIAPDPRAIRSTRGGSSVSRSSATAGSTLRSGWAPLLADRQ